METNYEDKVSVNDIDTGFSKALSHKEVLVYPADGYKGTGTILCQLDGPIPEIAQELADFPTSEIKFRIVGFDDQFMRFIVDIAFWDTDQMTYVSYRDHLCKKGLWNGEF